MSNNKIMEQVQALLARAEHPNTPAPEAELALDRANILITRHAIDEAMLRATQSESERRKPVVETWKWLETYSEFSAYFRTMLSEIARHNRCRAVINSSTREVTLVGFSEDVSWCQMLYMNCYYSFLSKLAPKWNNEKSFEENIYTFKIAGNKWNDIWVIMAESLDAKVEYDWYGRVRKPVVPYGAPKDYYAQWGVPCAPSPADGGWMIRAYKKWAKIIGDTNPIETQRFDAYRRSFAQGFSDRIGRRLEDLRMASEQEVATSAGNAVALRDAWADVEEEFYNMFPEHTPEAKERARLVTQEKNAEFLRKEREYREMKLAAMTAKQRADFLEKEERKRRRDIRSANTYWRDQDNRNRSDHSGARGGASAADGVSLTRSTSVDHEERKGIEG